MAPGDGGEVIPYDCRVCDGSQQLPSYTLRNRGQCVREGARQ